MDKQDDQKEALIIAIQIVPERHVEALQELLEKLFVEDEIAA